MRINVFVARATGLSRRAADKAVETGRVNIGGRRAVTGQQLVETDQVKLDGQLIKLPSKTMTALLNKPAGYVVSRDGQGSQTVYDLLPNELHHLKPVGRLDKDSSGLLILTDDGQLANRLTHPSFQKEKIYEITLNKNLSSADEVAIKKGIMLNDGLSSLKLTGKGRKWTASMREGRNRQIRRTFEAIGYRVVDLHRSGFGDFNLENLAPGKYRLL